MFEERLLDMVDLRGWALRHGGGRDEVGTVLVVDKVPGIGGCDHVEVEVERDFGTFLRR